MTNKEAADELQYAIDIIKQDGKDWLDERDIPILEAAISALQAQEAKHSKESSPTHKALDTISRKVAIDAVDSETVSTNPENFKSSEKFIKFMDDADIASFGKWQWANGFNTALVATTIQLKKLPSAEPELNFDEWCTDCKEYNHKRHCCPRWNRVIRQTLKDAQPEPQWIPVSERLPKVGHSVLFSRRSMDTREGCLQADGKWWQYRWNEILNADQVTAWMPLLEPYRAERRTDE